MRRNLTENYQSLRYELDGAVLLLTLDRKDRRNAWSADLETEYFDALDRADADPVVRAIVLTGAGESFCPGMDLVVLQARSAGDTSTYSALPRRPLNYPIIVRKPMIAAINGGCAGIGLLQALLCDVRFIADEAKIAAAFTTRGLPVEFGVSWLLPRLIGHAAALDLLISGRQINGVEAARLGLAVASVPRASVVETAIAYARNLTDNCSPAAMAVVKRQLFADWMRDHQSAVRESASIFEMLHSSPDFSEGINAFMEKRPARFAPLALRSNDDVTPHMTDQLESFIPRESGEAPNSTAE